MRRPSLTFKRRHSQGKMAACKSTLKGIIMFEAYHGSCSFSKGREISLAVVRRDSLNKVRQFQVLMHQLLQQG